MMFPRIGLLTQKVRQLLDKRKPVLPLGLKALLIVILFACLIGPAQAQEESALIKSMTGTWNVKERMWMGRGMTALLLPAALAHRQLVGSGLLQETMAETSGATPPFTRVAIFDYNAVTKHFEYASWDSRAPQMMVEKGLAVTRQSAFSLLGGTFVAPQWGASKNVTFRYRVEIGQIQNGHQTVRLYFSPLAGNTREFRAFEYLYTRSG